MMITVHPQRWHDRPLPWVKKLVWQNVKNAVKRAGVRLGLRVTLGYWLVERGWGVGLALWGGQGHADLYSISGIMRAE